MKDLQYILPRPTQLLILFRKYLPKPTETVSIKNVFSNCEKNRGEKICQHKMVKNNRGVDK